MKHILRKITDRTTINLLADRQIEIISQLMDQTLNLRLIIDQNSRITFQQVLQVVRKRTMIITRIQGTTTTQNRINGVVNLIWRIRDKIHWTQVLALIQKLRTLGHRSQTIHKAHIRMRHLTLGMVKNIRKILMKRFVAFLMSYIYLLT